MRFASISNNWGFYWIVCPNIIMSITPGKMNTWKKWIWWNCSAWWILGCTNVFGFFPLCLSFSFLLTFIFNASFSKCISNFILLVCSLNNTLETESIEKDMNDMSDLAHHVEEMEKEAHINTGQKKLDDCVFENQSRGGA